ncbi:hypothetical protein UFOVP154_54 [uncultured Caudovirales phage]|uniref:Uncharacterized protein n=1 Tax=uncultured Caudovirales phage TaxID=2100421 RepID=A0A6J7WCX0_9CAUD|nr:hypothetical protein UFOVP8_39 [uncultured Caudovirales phage]CAB5170881.1 hypothetical protein UFOVP154_54 [uncultured Caudovirales phage]
MTAAEAIAQLEAVLEYLKGIVAATPIVPPSPVPPTAPVLGSTTVVGSTITVPVNTLSNHVDGIAGYQVWRGTSSGAETYQGNTSVLPYVDGLLAAGTYYYKFRAYTPFGTNYSSFSNEVSGTVSGVLGPDTHAPATPSAPTSVSGGGTVTASLASITPTADTDGTPYGEVTSGADHVAWYDNGTNIPSNDSPVPNLGTNVVVQIGTVVTPGTDNGSTIVGAVTNGGGDPHYGATDYGFTYSRKPTTGKVTLIAQVNSASGADHWGKPFILEVRLTDSADSPYFNVLCFPSAGAAAVISEYRTSAGVQAAQSASHAYTLPFKLKCVYDPDTGIAEASWSQDLTNYTVINTQTIPAIGKHYYSGIAAAGVASTSAGYTNYSRTVDSVVRYAFTGTRQAGATTTRTITAKVVDAAGNSSAASGATTWSYDALSSSGVDVFPRIGGYVIATGAGRFDSAQFGEWLKHVDVAIISPGTDEATGCLANLVAAKSANPVLKIGVYADYGILYPAYGTRVDFANVAATVPGWLPYASPDTSQTLTCYGYPGGITHTINGKTLTLDEFAAWNLKSAFINNNADGFAFNYYIPANFTGNLDAFYMDDPRITVEGGTDPSQGNPLPAGYSDWNDLVQGGMANRMLRMESITGLKGWLNCPISGNSGGPKTVWPRLTGFQGGIIENMDGQMTWPTGGSAFETLRELYRKGTAAISGPYCIATNYHVNADGSVNNYYDSAVLIPAGEGIKFLFATYLCFAPSSGYTFEGGLTGNPGGAQSQQWFDLYSVDTSTGLGYTYPNVDAGRHWLGTAIDGPQTETPQSDGTFRREFQHGYAVTNSDANPSLNVTFPVNVRIVGSITVITAGTPITVGSLRGLVVVKA